MKGNFSGVSSEVGKGCSPRPVIGPSRNERIESESGGSEGIVATWTRRLLPLYLAFIFLTTTLASLSGYLKRNVVRIADWLINYQGGFVRRGLVGELILRLSDFFGLNPGLWVLVLQLSGYGVFFLYSYLLLRRVRGWLRLSLLVYSPFIFAFQINDIPGGFRKEVLYFALLAVLVWAARALEDRGFRRLFVGGLLMYPLLIFSHEMLAIFLPWLLIVYLLRFGMSRRNMVLLGLLLLPSILAFALSVSHSGRNIPLSSIVDPINARGYQINEDSGVEVLHWSLEDGADSVINHGRRLHFLGTYSLVLLLSAIPFLLIRDRLRKVFCSRFTMMLGLTSLLGTALLCVVAADWGRFIYIQAVSLFLISLTVTGEEKPIVLRGGVLLWVGPVLLYVLAWHIPHFGGQVVARSFSQSNAGAVTRAWSKFQNTIKRRKMGEHPANLSGLPSPGAVRFAEPHSRSTLSG